MCPRSDYVYEVATLAAPFLTAHLLRDFPRLAHGTLRDIARILRRSCGAVWIRLRFRKYEVDRLVGRMVHLALRAFVLAGRGALEFVRDALEF